MTCFPSFNARSRRAGASAPVLPGDAGAQARVVTMVFFSLIFPYPLYHPFLRPSMGISHYKSKEAIGCQSKRCARSAGTPSSSWRTCWRSTAAL
nr:MAG TPA: hypothetical protein [Caudoviricetes sp.]